MTIWPEAGKAFEINGLPRCGQAAGTRNRALV
jgi:hypothetical protein